MWMRAAAIVLLATIPGFVQGAEDPPFLYELVINGETFVIEGNRAVTVESRQHRGVKYDLALRLAQTQRLSLNTVQFDYDLGFSVEDDEDAEVRTARLRHELGFTMTVTDLGGPLPEKSRADVLGRLVKVMEKKLAAEQAKDVAASKPVERKFKKVTAGVVSIKYTDADGFARVCLIRLLHSDKFCCSCTLDCFQPDQDDAAPIVQRTLDSFRAK